MTSPQLTNVSRILAYLAGMALIASLYLAKGLLIPMALAVLLTFLLTPVVHRLERLRVNRIVAVIFTTTLTFALLGAMVYVVAGQLIDLANELPKYRANLIEKALAFKPNGESPLNRVLQTVEDVGDAMHSAEADPSAPLTEGPPSPNLPASAKQPAVPVEIIRQVESPFALVGQVAASILNPLADAAMIVVIVIFMLLGREDLRDRVVHLVGRTRLRLTTQALDEASSRVSRYLLAQLVVNVTYGIPIAVGLYFIGVPNAILWGMFATVLRFLPYVGPFIAASFPIVLSLAVSSSWSTPLLTIALFVTIELISNNVVEPWLYGASTGLSPIAIIVSAVFWTWLWGALGLVLATPLTVCLAVLGKYIPGLAFLDLLLGDRPPIAASDRLYQRLLAVDAEEAVEIVEDYAKEHSLVEALDHVLLPAIEAMEREYREGTLPDSARLDAFRLIRQIISDLEEDIPKIESAPRALCLPAMHEADELAGLLLALALRERKVNMEVLSSKLLISELVESALEEPASLYVVSTVPPASVLSAVKVTKQLQIRSPGCRIVVGLWQQVESERDRRIDRFNRISVSDVFTRLDRAIAEVTALVRCEPAIVVDASGSGDLQSASS